jgi:hypothetical protein
MFGLRIEKQVGAWTGVTTVTYQMRRLDATTVVWQIAQRRTNV